LVDVRDAQVVFSDDARTASGILIARQLEIVTLTGPLAQRVSPSSITAGSGSDVASSEVQSREKAPSVHSPEGMAERSVHN
jgi:hypothetical protein